MRFEVRGATTESLNVAPMASGGAQALLVTTPAKPTFTYVFECQERFGRLLGTRGLEPTPKGLWRIIGRGEAWGIVATAISTTVALPLAIVSGAAIGDAAGITAAVTGVSAFFGAVVGQGERGPLSIVSRHRSLTQQHVEEATGGSPDTDTQRVALGLLAKRWLDRLDKQVVKGVDGYEATHELVRRGDAARSPEQRALAEKVIALYDVAYDAAGLPHKELTDAMASAIVSAFHALPSDERAAARPVLFRQYFKRGDLPRFKAHDARTAHTLFVGLRREDVPAIEAPKDAQSSAA